MSLTPFEYVEGLRVGIVEFVSPDEIKVGLDIETPESVALNTGTPRSFPRVNSYVLIPNDAGYLVGQVEWMTVERSAFPKRRGMQDFGLIDLPFPLRKMSLNPLGTLRRIKREEYKFQRGADSYPTIGDGVYLPTDNQLRSIIESGDNRHVKIGTSSLAGNAKVCVDPDRLFGRHLAVLGNTGSGKSCSVAGLIRWSIEAARDKRGSNPNARFIILDPNGEYTKAFSSEDSDIKARIFKVSPLNEAAPLHVPLWFWNSAEWSSFTRAKEGAQRPLLRRALREVKLADGQESSPVKLILRRKLSTILIAIRNHVRSGDNYEGWKFCPKLPHFAEDLETWSQQYTEFNVEILGVKSSIDQLLRKPGLTYRKNDGSTGYNNLSCTAVTPLVSKLEEVIQSLGGIVYSSGPSEDSPVFFDGQEFADHLESLAEQETNPHFFDFLILRIRTMLSDTRLKSIIDDTGKLSLDQWLTDYIGSNNADNGNLTIIDLSLVPTEIIHIVVAVVARMVFEALQRYRNLNQIALPTVLVMEEAHTFIKRYKEDVENQDAASVCCQVFERIAREGRKFGLGLVLSSQRPSELSPTVLSQCNSYLLHRISNDRDQELIHRLVPDNLKGLLRELPSLPSQNAILLGWASELPVLVKMNDLPKSQQPHSSDPDFWDVWTGCDKKCKPVIREVDWKKISDDWQQNGVDVFANTESPPVGDANEGTEEVIEEDDPF